MDAAAMTDDLDRTPVSVTLPAHAWKTVQEACRVRARRLRVRSQQRPPPEGLTDLDGLRAETLEEAAALITEIRDAGQN